MQRKQSIPIPNYKPSKECSLEIKIAKTSSKKINQNASTQGAEFEEGNFQTKILSSDTVTVLSLSQHKVSHRPLKASFEIIY